VAVPERRPVRDSNHTTPIQSGFSLIEVMVATLVISVSVLGMAGMQITAKRAGHEAVQRTSATSLAMDLMERMRANPAALASYVTTGVGNASISTEPVPNCSDDGINACTAAQRAAHDLWDWERAIDGATETRVVDGDTISVGGLLDPTACIAAVGGLITVSIAWEGYQRISNPTSNACGAGLDKYGTDDAKRQVLSMNTFITQL
jgi:type IV pilus assembly protein PilV